MITVLLGSLPKSIRIRSQDHSPCFFGDLNQQVVDILEVDFRHGQYGGVKGGVVVPDVWALEGILQDPNIKIEL
jgi:hypothetical protein